MPYLYSFVHNAALLLILYSFNQKSDANQLMINSESFLIIQLYLLFKYMFERTVSKFPTTAD